MKTDILSSKSPTEKNKTHTYTKKKTRNESLHGVLFKLIIQ